MMKKINATLSGRTPLTGGKADLMGDLTWMLALPAYQLVFPFSPEDQRRLALVECLNGTTCEALAGGTVLRDTTPVLHHPGTNMHLKTRVAMNE